MTYDETKSGAPWLPSHNDIWSSMKFRRLVRALAPATAETVFGHLFRLWHSQITSNRTGELPGWTADDLADAANWTLTPADAFASAMLAHGWVHPLPGGGFELHEWASYGGSFLAARDSAAERKRNERSKKAAEKASMPVTVTSHGHPQDVTHNLHRGQDIQDQQEGERTSPALPPVEADEVLPAGPEERAEARRSGAVVRSSLRDHRSRYAQAGGLMGRPQNVDALLALRVKELPDGRMVTAPEDGRPLRELWVERYPTLDGKGQPRRKTVAEIAEVLWPYEVNRAWTLDGAGYLSWWTGKVAEEAEKARRAWEAQGGATAGDPDRLEAKKRHLYLQGLGRDLPPFPTWYEEKWRKGLDRRDVEEPDPPPTGPSGGTRPSGQTRALPSPSITVDPFAAAGIDPNAKAPNLTAMAEAARRRQRDQETA